MYEDIENQDENKAFTSNKPNSSYNQMNPRMGFIRKVYGILSFQLLLTVILCLAAMSSKSYFNFMMSAPGMALFIFSIIMSLITCILLVCFRKLSRTTPTNYILLTLFTLCEGYTVSYSCAMSSPKIVLMAAIMTLGITLALTLYALTTKTDFTFMGGMLFVGCTVMLLIGIFMMFTSNPFLHVLFSGFGVLLYGVYLIYDTQLLMGNKKHELELDDYILGALFIYLDIILIFLYLLDILNSLDRN